MRCDLLFFFFFQAEDGIRDLVRSRGLGDVYKRQGSATPPTTARGFLDGSGFNRTGSFVDAREFDQALSLIHI